VWVGYPQAQIPMENVHGISVAGGTFPAEIWRRFMSVAMEGKLYLDWLQPKHEPEWRDFDTGQYALEFVQPSYSPPAPAPTEQAKPPPANPAPPPGEDQPPAPTVPPPPPAEPPPPPTEPGAVAP
jgi:membrane peptidoglycan carboxypeptidase